MSNKIETANTASQAQESVKKSPISLEKSLDKLVRYGGFDLLEASIENVQNVNPNFVGKNFLFTGTLKHFTREQIKEEIEKLGGKNLSSVSKNLDYLIVGEKAGSKLKKAQEIPTIKILTEEEFIELKDKFD